MKTEGVIAKFKKEQLNIGKVQGEKTIILELLKDHSMDWVSSVIHRDVDEILKIISD